MITVSGGEGEPGVFDGPGLDGWVVGGRVVRGFVLSPYNLVPGDWVFGIIIILLFFLFGISLVLYSFLLENPCMK